MRFSMLIAGIFAMLVLAMPILAVDFDRDTIRKLAHDFAGSVLDHDGKAYMLNVTEPGNVRVITDRVNGEWMKPDSFFVDEGYTCKFYQESTRGIGSLIGGYTGPLVQSFGTNDWAAFYECYESIQGGTNVSTVPTDLHARGATMIPCGSVHTANGGRASLNEGSRGQMFEFAINGELYTPVDYRVSNGCECRFYSARTVRGGAEMITACAGPSDGQFGDSVATRYQCWLRN